MNALQTIRIAALLAIIFAAGVWTGRLTARKPRQETAYASAGPRGQSMTAELALERFKGQFSLTAEQEVKMRKVFEDIEAEVSKYPPLSKERVDVLRKFAPQMKAALNTNQADEVDRYIRQVEVKAESMRKRRGGN
jgi:hypothetical protein